MSTTHPVDQVEAYLAEVRERLSGLPDEERAELLEDVSAHVREVADEHGADQLSERLGTPAEFGDELRSSAGFSPVEESSATATRARWRSRLDDLRETTLVKRVVQEWPRLEPTWWLLRGVFVVWLLVSISEVDPSLVPRIGESRLLGLLVLGAAAAASFALGDRRPPRAQQRLRRTRIAGEVALAIFGLLFIADSSQTRVQYIDNGYSAERDPCMRDSAGRAIGNLHAFDPAGQRIPQFFLTDQAGRPIDNLCPDDAESNNQFGPAKTTYARDANGAAIYNVFPRAQERVTAMDPRTGLPSKTEPVPPPAVVFPQVATTTVPAPSG